MNLQALGNEKKKWKPQRSRIKRMGVRSLVLGIEVQLHENMFSTVRLLFHFFGGTMAVSKPKYSDLRELGL